MATSRTEDGPRVLAEVVRAAIRAAASEPNGSIQAIADEAGVPHQTVSRFLEGGDTKLSTVDKLAKPLNLVLHQMQGKHSGRRKR